MFKSILWDTYNHSEPLRNVTYIYIVPESL
jgi:hypothetical protein